jgi:hypothetical protein
MDTKWTLSDRSQETPAIHSSIVAAILTKTGSHHYRSFCVWILRIIFLSVFYGDDCKRRDAHLYMHGVKNFPFRDYNPYTSPAKPYGCVSRPDGCLGMTIGVRFLKTDTTKTTSTTLGEALGETDDDRSPGILAGVQVEGLGNLR